MSSAFFASVSSGKVNYLRLSSLAYPMQTAAQTPDLPNSLGTPWDICDTDQTAPSLPGPSARRYT